VLGAAPTAKEDRHKIHIHDLGFTGEKNLRTHKSLTRSLAAGSSWVSSDNPKMRKKFHLSRVSHKGHTDSSVSIKEEGGMT